MFFGKIPTLPMETWIIILGSVGLFAVLTLFAIWDAFKREFPSNMEKVGWIQLSIFIPFENTKYRIMVIVKIPKILTKLPTILSPHNIKAVKTTIKNNPT